MVKYHEIQPLENAASKINSELDQMLATKPGMYNKTKKRYRQLASDLLQCVEKISRLIEEDDLISDSTDEFDELSKDSQPLDNISLTSELDHAKSVYQSTSSFMSTKASKHRDYDALVNQYHDVLYQTIDSDDICCSEAKTCAELISKWFDCRFINNSANFKCNMKQLPIWISNMIILFGKYQSDGNISKFTDMMNTWIINTESGQNDRWAVPYEVFQLSKESEPEDFTLSSIAINRMLFNAGYWSLTSYCEGQVPDIFLDADTVPRIVKEHNPTLLPKLRNTSSNLNKLIEECNLTKLEALNE